MALPGDFKDYPEPNLISACLSGDDAAYAELSRRVVAAASHQLRSLSADDQEDVESIVLEKVFAGLASYDPERGAFATWINAIARSSVIDHIRSRRMFSAAVSFEDNAIFLEKQISLQWDGISYAYVEHARDMVLSTIDAVENDLLREYLIGRFVLLLDDAFLADIFEVSPATVRSNLRRALNEFASLFVKRYPELENVDFQAFTRVLKDGAVPVTEEKLQAMEDPVIRSVMTRVCLDRFSITRTSEDLGLPPSDILKSLRKGIPGLLRTSPVRQTEAPSVAEPSLPYQTEVFPQSVADLILAALSFRSPNSYE